MKKSVQSSNNCKERDVIERDACASLRAMGQYVVDVVGFEEFREGEITLTTNEEKKLMHSDGGAGKRVRKFGAPA